MGKGKVIQNEDPRLNLFSISERGKLIERFNTHKQWLEDAANAVNNSIPDNFTKKMEWVD